MKKPIIRNSKIEDKLAVKDAHIRSIRQICAKDYRPEQIDAWAQPPYTDDHWAKSVNEELHQVIELDGKIEGFCHSTVHENGEGEILGLYLTSEVCGLGVGKEIFQNAMDYIRQFKPTKVIIGSTVTAKGFYERMGFKVVGEKMKFEIRGEKIDYYQMELEL